MIKLHEKFDFVHQNALSLQIDIQRLAKFVSQLDLLVARKHTFQTLDLLLSLIFIIFCLLKQILHIVVDNEIFWSLDMLSMFRLVVINLIGFFLVNDGVPKSQFTLFSFSEKLFFQL